MSSASKTEMRMVYLNGKATIPVLISLEEMGHSQVPKPLKTDNNTAEGFLKNYSEKKVKGFWHNMPLDDWLHNAKIVLGLLG